MNQGLGLDWEGGFAYLFLLRRPSRQCRTEGDEMGERSQLPRLVYPPGWWLVEPAYQMLALQHDRLSADETRQFSALVQAIPKPTWADGYAVVPKHSVLARHPLVRDLDVGIYGRALTLVITLLTRVAEEYGWVVVSYVDKLTAKNLVLRPRTAEVFARLEQKPGFLTVFPVQMGAVHIGLSPVAAIERMDVKEFPLDPVTVGWILYAHFVKLIHSVVRPSLWIDCPGACYAPQDNAKFLDTPRWEVDPGNKLLLLDWNWESRARHRHGTATGLEP